MTKDAYRAFDLTVLTAILVALEAAAVFTKTTLFDDELFTLSVVVPMLIIIMLRWRGWATVSIVIGAIATCAFRGASLEQYVIYTLGYLSVLALLPLTKTKMLACPWRTLGFTLAAFGCVCVTLALVSQPFQPALESFLLFPAAEALNIVIGTIIIQVARRQKGLLTFQPEFLVEQASRPYDE